MSKIKVPSRPPPMSFIELPLYKSPHYEYKDFVTDERIRNCPDYNKKLIQSYLFPRVKEKRLSTSKFIYDLRTGVKERYENTAKLLKSKTVQFVNNARHPDNAMIGEIVNKSSSIVGFVLGRRMGRYKDSLIKGVFGAGVAYFATGALFKPQETDEQFREICFIAAKEGLKVVNAYYKTNIQLDTLLCRRNLPAPTVVTPKSVQCKKQ